jgi:hypothetical protein
MFSSRRSRHRRAGFVVAAMAATMLLPAVASAAPPANDPWSVVNNSVAFDILTGAAPSSQIVNGTLAESTREAGEPVDGSTGGTVWYGYVSNQQTIVTLDTCQSTDPAMDTVLSVYTGNAVNALTRIGEAADGAPAGTCGPTSQIRPSWLRFTAQPGTLYFIRIAAFSSISDQHVPFVLSASEEPAAPEGSWTPASLNSSDQAATTIGPAQKVTLSNTGNLPLNVSNLGTAGTNRLDWLVVEENCRGLR